VRRAHGIGGDVVVRGLLTDAAQRFVVGAVFLTDQERPREYRIETVRPHQGDYIIGFSGIRDRNGADELRGVQFTIDIADRRELEPGEWWPEDLKGCDVVSIEGVSIGYVVNIITGASQDRLAVEALDGTVGEIPFVEALVSSVDVLNQRIIVDLPDGIFGT
jgi:16S rRNA processing protein RimM